MKGPKVYNFERKSFSVGVGSEKYRDNYDDFDWSDKGDPDTHCPTCQIPLEPEHAHMRCKKCGYRDSCCF